jgi:hypothetical protein
MLKACFGHQMREGRSGELSPSEGDRETWMMLLLAMYNCKELPRYGFSEYRGPLLVKALVLADYCLVTEEVKITLANMMTAHFAELQRWNDVPFCPLTHIFHEQVMNEVNQTYVMYRDCNASFKPFELEAFGLMITLLCASGIYDTFEEDLDPGLVRLISRNAMKVAHRVATKPLLSTLFISMDA